MHSIIAVSVNEALYRGLNYLTSMGVEEQSRNGPVIVSSVPVCTTYTEPRNRVLFSPTRDANPFFHLMESLWMLAGRNDLDWPAQFNKNFASYSDDGKTVHGAYGYCWRQLFGYDQLSIIANELRSNPNSRRCVLAMWNPSTQIKDDFGYSRPCDLVKATTGGKDVPCNTHAYFDCRGGKLNLTVLCRSNDIVWGAYGANAVHFSILLEYMAAWIGVPVGVYNQISVNFHLYPEIFGTGKISAIVEECRSLDFYRWKKTDGQVLIPLVGISISDWDEDLHNFLAQPLNAELSDPFFKYVAQPMYRTWYNHKLKNGMAKKTAWEILSWDWRTAVVQWLARREKKTEAAGA